MWRTALLASATIALLACTPSAPPDPTGAARPLELSCPNDIETFDPRYASDAYSLRAVHLVHAGLARLDPDTLEPRPYLAKSWRWVDALTLHVELRDDVRFHSGAPLTPKDVAATIAAFQSPEIGSRHLRVVEAIGHIDADGPHAVNIFLSRPHATLLTDLDVPILRADQAMSAPDPDGALDGLGPYRVTRSTRGDVLLEPADGSALPRPAHAVVLRTVHDDNARALRLIAGKSDLALNILALAPALDGKNGLHVIERPARSSPTWSRGSTTAPSPTCARAAPSRSGSIAPRSPPPSSSTTPTSPPRSSRRCTGPTPISRPSPSTPLPRARSWAPRSAPACASTRRS